MPPTANPTHAELYIFCPKTQLFYDKNFYTYTNKQQTEVRRKGKHDNKDKYTTLCIRNVPNDALNKFKAMQEKGTIAGSITDYVRNAFVEKINKEFKP